MPPHRVPLCLAIASIGIALTARPFAATEVPTGAPASACVDVRASTTIAFSGRTLVETPDILEPEIRLANAQLNAQCPDLAARTLTAFSAAHPENYHVAFVYARILWIGGNRGKAETIATKIATDRPLFTSMKVLLASMRIDDHDIPGTERLLNDVEARHPDDLWLYMDRLRIEAIVRPTAEIGETLHKIVLDSRFPPTARRQAAMTANDELRNQTAKQRDEMFRAQMVDLATATDCTLIGHAREVIEQRHDPRAGAEEIERYAGHTCAATADVRVLLAEAYLLQAAQIASRPGAKTAALVKRSRVALGGDLTPLAWHVAAKPDLDAIIPFLDGAVDSRKADADGRTALCYAVLNLNVPMVKAELIRGANPRDLCEKRTPLARLIHISWPEPRVKERQAVLRLLLESGAPVEEVDFCADRRYGDCTDVLLPILRDHESRRARNRVQV